jgi:hypothetical protein
MRLGADQASRGRAEGGEAPCQDAPTPSAPTTAKTTENRPAEPERPDVPSDMQGFANKESAPVGGTVLVGKQRP